MGETFNVINKVMTHQSCKIGCMYKTSFHKSGYIYSKGESLVTAALQPAVLANSMVSLVAIITVE